MVSTLADSYLHATFHSAGSAAKTASVRKESKYSVLLSDYVFQPVALETLGPLNASTLNFLSEVCRRLTSLSSHEGWKAESTKHCSKDAQPVLKTVYRSSCRDKHNCQRRDSNLGPLTPQSGALTTRPLRPVASSFTVLKKSDPV